MKENTEWKILFKDDWCPLFGELPPLKEPLSSPTARCIMAIKDAREILSEKASSKEYLTLVNSLFKSFSILHPFVIMPNPQTHPWATTHTLATNIDSTIQNGRWYLKDYSNNHDLISGYEILTVAAIGQAWTALDYMLYDNLSDEMTVIRDRVQVATDLLSKAKSMAVLEDVNRGKKVLSGAKKSGESRRNQIIEDRLPIWDEWQNMANILWKKHPKWSKLSVAKEISKQSSDSVETIRKRIKQKN